MNPLDASWVFIKNWWEPPAPGGAPAQPTQPTQAPTAQPTQAPTAQPTQAPTAQPTQAPTAQAMTEDQKNTHSNLSGNLNEESMRTYLKTLSPEQLQSVMANFKGAGAL